jgi:hypothetical protein
LQSCARSVDPYRSAPLLRGCTDVTLSTSLRPTLLPTLPRGPFRAARTAAAAGVSQTGSASFAASSQTDVDSVASLGGINLDAATTRLTVALNLKANQKYSFSVAYSSGAPAITLTDGMGKATKVDMTKGFTVKATGSYQLTFDAPYSLRNVAGLQNLRINAVSVLPTTSGDKNLDALLRGGTGEWWHTAEQAPTKGTDKVSTDAIGLAAGSSVANLTYSLLTSQPGGQSMNGFSTMRSAQQSAIRGVLDYYEKLINVNFTEVSSGTGNIDFGTNSQASSAGYAYLPGTSGVKDKTFVFLANNTSSNNDAGMRVGSYGWETLLHEIGHAMGLKHPGNYNAGGGGAPGPFLAKNVDARQYTMMSYYDNNATRGVNPTTAMLYDVPALQYMYGANTAASTAQDGAFSFTNSTYLQTLWSPTGTDRIDVSGTTTSNDINLNAGSFSSIAIQRSAVGATSYSGNSNVAIAYGSTINQVVLSSRSGVSDSVTLNSAYAAGGYNAISNFDASVDKVALKKSLFKGAGTTSFEVGSVATKSATRILINQSTGDLLYDADGSGSKYAAKRIAQFNVLGGSGVLTGANLSFVA